MHPDLERLILLQRVEIELRRVETELQGVPAVLAAAEAALAAERAQLDAARGELAESQKQRKQKEGEVEDLKARRSKYKTQLMEVKTNKEYTAMLHEIEGVERSIREREDEILVEMERAEALQADIKREEQAFKEAESRHRVEAGRLEERRRVLGADQGRLDGERASIAETVSEDALELFGRVARLRGTGLAEARDETCQACRVKLRPQMYVDLRHNDEIVQCPACNRILYYETPPPVVAPQP
jgi:predicted  nucleic acid-binding Zn-ribbon protein